MRPAYSAHKRLSKIQNKNYEESVYRCEQKYLKKYEVKFEKTNTALVPTLYLFDAAKGLNHCINRKYVFTCIYWNLMALITIWVHKWKITVHFLAIHETFSDVTFSDTNYEKYFTLYCANISSLFICRNKNQYPKIEWMYRYWSREKYNSSTNRNRIQ